MRLRLVPIHTVLAIAAFVVAAMPNAGLAQKVQGLYAGNDPSLPTIDVYYSVLWYDFKTEDVSADSGSTPFTDVPTDITIDAAVAEGNSTSSAEAFFTASYSFASDTNYVKIVNGVRDTVQFAPNPDGRSIAVGVHGIDNVRRFAQHPDSVDVFVYHGSTDTPAIHVADGGGDLVAEGLRYGDNGAYFTVAANTVISLAVSRASDGLAYGIYTGTVGPELAGQAAIIMIRGFVDPSTNMNGRALIATVVPAEGAAFDLALETSTAVDESEVLDAGPDVLLVSTWPNPVADRVSVRVSSRNVHDAAIRVIDVLGREVMAHRAVLATGESSLVFNVSSLPTGQYIVVVASGKWRSTRAFTITR